MNAGSAQDTIRREAQSASEALHEARDEVARKAGEYASEAKAAAMEQAEVAQQDVSASLAAFGGALRAAGDHLAGSNQRAASQFMLHGLPIFAGCGFTCCSMFVGWAQRFRTDANILHSLGNFQPAW